MEEQKIIKPTIKAGALIAAELDRITRAEAEAARP